VIGVLAVKRGKREREKKKRKREVGKRRERKT
jgi:hypothetical protein